MLQREVESTVRLPRWVRIGLAAVVLLGAAAFIAVGAILVAAVDRSVLLHPAAALAMMGSLIALGAAFAYVGYRLLRIRAPEDPLFSARGARNASYCIVALTLASVAGGLLLGYPELAAGVLFGLPMAWWLYRGKPASR